MRSQIFLSLRSSNFFSLPARSDFSANSKFLGQTRAIFSNRANVNNRASLLGNISHRQQSLILSRTVPAIQIISTRNYSFSGDDRRSPRPPRTGGRLIGPLMVGGSILFGKLKYLLIAMKVTKAAPLISMAISSFAYSFIFGWPYACGMVGMIFIHECGHVLVMNHYGIPFKPMVFIPFMGAAIAMEENPVNSYQDAIIAFGGPVLGSVGAVATGIAGHSMDSQLLMALSDWGLMINLFNLLPIGSMDGGRIGNAISPYFGVAGLGIGGYMVYEGLISNPLVYLILAGGCYSTVMRFIGRQEYHEDYYKISPGDQAKLFAAYAGLVAALIYAMRENNKGRKSPKQLQRNQSYNWYSDLYEEKEEGVFDDYFGNLISDDENGRFS